MTEQEFWQSETAGLPHNFLTHLIEVTRGICGSKDLTPPNCVAFVHLVASKIGDAAEPELDKLKVPFEFEEESACPTISSPE